MAILVQRTETRPAAASETLVESYEPLHRCGRRPIVQALFVYEDLLAFGDSALAALGGVLLRRFLRQRELDRFARAFERPVD